MIESPSRPTPKTSRIDVELQMGAPDLVLETVPAKGHGIAGPSGTGLTPDGSCSVTTTIAFRACQAGVDVNVEGFTDFDEVILIATLLSLS